MTASIGMHASTGWRLNSHLSPFGAIDKEYIDYSRNDYENKIGQVRMAIDTITISEGFNHMHLEHSFHFKLIDLISSPGSLILCYNYKINYILLWRSLR